MAGLAHFRVIFILSAIKCAYIVPGDSYSLMGVTPTPFGGGQDAVSFTILRKNSGNSVARAVKLGADPSSEDLLLPLGSSYDTGTGTWNLPGNLTAVGAYRGSISSADIQESVAVIIHAANRQLQPAGGIVTVRASIGDTITLSLENVANIIQSQIQWERFSDFSMVQMGGLSYTMADVTADEEDFYGAFQNGTRAELRYSLLKLIVRDCPAGLWGPPSCQNRCANCYNGGMCSDVTGECMCAPGFDGENCMTACGESMYGWECRYKCEPGQALAQCSGSHVCLPDPYGCNCLSGYTGAQCTLPCPIGTFGAGCDQMCHCTVSANCDRFTGVCSDGQCADDWSGVNCQVPDVCPPGFFGVNCTNLCNCLDNGACHRVTADCFSTGGLCAPGYASNEVRLADCQFYEGCFDSCTKTCHCRSGADNCDAVMGACSSGGCLSEWIGPACQTGIAEVGYIKSNQGQSTDLTCIIESPFNASSLIISGRLDTLTGTVIDVDSVESMGPLLNVVFTVPPGHFVAYCSVSVGGETASSGQELTHYALPTLANPPSVVSFDMENATIEWMSWKAGSNSSDRGEGPIIGYTVYYQAVVGSVEMAGSVSEANTSTTHRFTVGGLTPGSTYMFYVSATRAGEGGEGPRGAASAPKTLPAIPATMGVMTTRKISTAPGIAGTQSPSAGTDVLYIVLPVVIIICIVVIVLVLVLIGIQRRRRRKFFHERRERIILESQAMNQFREGVQDNHNNGYKEIVQLTPSPDEVDGDMEIDKRQSRSSPPTGPPTAPRPPSHFPKPIPVADFSTCVQMNRRSGAFEDEWSLLPPDLSKPCRIAQLANNKPKNRYRNILAYDHSRVVLDEIEGVPCSDYINACYIKSCDKEGTYIATQGPNRASLHDFWRMVWKENVRNIVMVTNLVEDGKSKCLQYWPADGEVETYGTIIVSCHSEEMCYHYVVRILIITNGQESRTVKQFHYQGWPDKGVPRLAAPVLGMIKDVNRSQSEGENGPLLVHCSAGAGRTGVIIAVDSILREAMKSQTVDIFSLVRAMRDDRPQMVQTPEQYAFVYEAVLEGLLCGNTFLKAADIPARVDQLQWPNPDTGKTALQEEFEVLQVISGDLKGQQKWMGSNAENMDKNRYPEIIPQDRCRPYLMTPGENGESTNYINASFVPSYSKKNGFITTQMPLQNTVVDFWRMVYDYRIETIVMLNQLSDPSCSIYWPVNTRALTFGSFTVTHKGSENMNRVKVRTLELSFNQEERQVRQFEVQTWPNSTPDTKPLDALLQLMEYLLRCERETGKEGDSGPTGCGSPIAVHCLSGINESGVFCTLLNCLEQLQSEGAIDVFQNLRVMRIARPRFVPNINEYLLVYQLLARQCVLDEADEEDDEAAVYENRRAIDESLYQNVDFSRMPQTDEQPPSSVC